MLSNQPELALLCLFPHPDDEFAVFPWISKAIAEGRTVELVWLTDGGFGGQDIVRRRRESEEIVARLGVPARNLHFIGESESIADGTLHERLADAVACVDGFASQLGAFEIMMPAWEGGHQDHDACHLVGLALSAKRSAPAWEFSLYHGEGMPGLFFKVLSPLQRSGTMQQLSLGWRQRIACIRYCLDYRSQWKSFLGLLPFYAWQLRHADAFKRRSASFLRTGIRPHPGKLLYERRTGLVWEEFARVTAAFRAGL